MERGRLGAAARDTFDALVRIEALRTARHQPANGARYGRDEFSAGLARIAQLIRADVGLEAASVDLPGWDSHFAQAGQVESWPTVWRRVWRRFAATSVHAWRRRRWWS
jgi:hypothetical protein